MSNAAIQLSKMPQAFFSGCELNYLQRSIYSSLSVLVPVINTFRNARMPVIQGLPVWVPVINPFNCVRIPVIRGLPVWSPVINPFNCVRIPVIRGLPVINPFNFVRTHIHDEIEYRLEDITQVLRTLFGWATVPLIPISPPILILALMLISLETMKMYDLKVKHEQSYKLLKYICDHIRTLNFKEYREHGIYKAFHKAVKYGTVEIISEFVKVNPAFMYVGDKKGRNMFQASIVYRQERVFSLFYGVEGTKEALIYVRDKHENTVLHLAAMLSPVSRLDRISGAALQMQRELQWFKEVESIIDPVFKERKNKYGETASQMFTKRHKDLKKGGEEWMKETAKSSTTVGTLIITAMFSAALVVPSGIRKDRFPIFSDITSYQVFKISNAISLVASSTAVLTFLSVLTSHYAEKHFLKSLPAKLAIGLFALFIAITAMMVAFCAALPMTLEGQWTTISQLSAFAFVPIIHYVFYQFGLIFEVIRSTSRWGVFHRKKKRWY